MERFQTEFDVTYGYWYNAMCETLYRRIDLLCNAVQLIGGSAAFAGVAASLPGWVGASGLVLALTAAVSLLVQPAVKAERHAQIKCRWLELQGRASSLSDKKLTAEVADLQKSDLGVPLLSLPASNAAMRALGYVDGFARLGPLQWLASKFAL